MSKRREGRCERFSGTLKTRAPRSGRLLLACVLVQLIWGTVSASAQSYTLTNLSLGGTWGGVRPNGINASGQVAGHSATAPGRYHAFVWTGSSLIDLTPEPPGVEIYSAATGINESGQVVGYEQRWDGATYQWQVRAFLWTPGEGLTYLPIAPPSPGGYSYSYAMAINDSGQVVGYEYRSDSAGGWAHRAFSWTESGGLVYLTPPDHTAGATDVNNQGQVIGWQDGYAPNGTWTRRVFAWTASGGLVYLPTPAPPAGGGAYSLVEAINDSGRVIGNHYLYDSITSETRAFSWTANEGLILLSAEASPSGGQTHSYASAINSAGEAVGGENQWDPAASRWSSRATSWTPAGVVRYLPTAPAAPGAQVHSWAHGVNSSSQVVGEEDHYDATNGWRYRAVSWAAGAGVSYLDELVSGSPSGLELWWASAVSDNGSIVVGTNAGMMLLSPSGGGPRAAIVSPITVSSNPVAVNTLITAGATFTDANAGDTHTVVWNWGDGTPAQAGTVSESSGAGSVSGVHAFTAAGVYQMSATVRDSSGLETQVSREVVVYDPSAGFVTGGGWIHSPAGAYKADTRLTGRATFGFVSKYQKGATRPSGTTEFHFQAANFRFFSDDYEWLVVAGARAQYKGSGSLNGVAGYKFLLTAVDGARIAKGTTDRFRIKIWHYDSTLETDVVDYDNQLDSATEGGNSEGTAIGGGSIVIHSQK